MGLGRIGPPLLHDARVYLSKDTVDQTPAGTVTTNSDLTNAPLVVRSVDDAILAAIELHDLPAPDDANTPRTPGAGCPVPPDATNVDYGAQPKDGICPPYDSTTSQTNRSDAREVIYRFRQLSSDDQQAVIEFLKQL
jgi:phage tail sheath protein FI